MKKTYERISEIRDSAAGISSGDVVWVGGSEGAANEFLSALCERKDELHHVTLLVVTGNGPSTALKTLRESKNFRVLNFYGEALRDAYNNSGCFGKYELVTAPAAKAISLVCLRYGVNVMVTPVCPPDKNGRCAVDARQVQTALAVSACPTVRKRIGLVDYHMKPSRDCFRLDAFDVIGLYGDFRTRDIFDNLDTAVRRSEKAA